MSTEVKNIIVALKAKLDNAFKRTLDAGASTVSAVAAKAAAAAKWIGIAGAAAAGGIGAMVVRVAGGMDATGKLADRLGMTTEALVGLQHAAKLADVGDLGGALEGWNKRLGEAVGGTGAAKDALTALGLKAIDLVKLPMDQQILRLADALGKVQNPAAKAALSAALFGRTAGAEMVTLLGQGSAAVRESMGEAEKLGLTYNRATAGIAEAFNDNLTRIRAAVTGAATQAAAAILPWFSAMSETLVGWAQKAMPFFQAATEGAFRAISRVIGVFGTVISTVFDAAKAVLGGFGVTFSDVGNTVGRIVDWIVGAITWFAAGVIKAITFVESIFVNWRDTLEIVWKGALLGGVVFYETLKHWFTVALPAYLSWFGRNWRALFTDIWNATKTIIGNIWKNLADFFGAVWKWLKGEGWDFQWTGLLEGFKSTVEKLPAIAARTRTALEESLSGDIAAASERIGSYYQTKVTARLAKLDVGKRAADAAGVAAETAADKATAAAAKAAGAVTAPGAGVTAKADEQQREFGVLGAGMRLSGLIAGALGVGGQDSQKKTAENTGKLVTLMEQLNQQAAGSEGLVLFTEGGD